MKIIVTIEDAAKKKGVMTQKDLLAVVEEKTGKKLRQATISDMYRDNNRSINREYLEVIAEALDITDIRELITLEK